MKDLKEEMKRLTFLIDYAAQERLREIFFQCQQKRTVQLEEGSFIFVSSDKMAAWLLFFPPVGMEHQQSKEEIQQQLGCPWSGQRDQVGNAGTAAADVQPVFLSFPHCNRHHAGSRQRWICGGALSPNI